MVWALPKKSTNNNIQQVKRLQVNTHTQDYSPQFIIDTQNRHSTWHLKSQHYFPSYHTRVPQAALWPCSSHSSLSLVLSAFNLRKLEWIQIWVSQGVMQHSKSCCTIARDREMQQMAMEQYKASGLKAAGTLLSWFTGFYSDHLHSKESTTPIIPLNFRFKY